MATIVLQAAGAYLGGLLGSTAAAIGTAAGALGGYLIDRALIGSLTRSEGPRLGVMPAFGAEEGAPLPRLYGTARLSGTMIWATRFEETATTTRQGYKGGPRTTEYSYTASAAFALCEGEIAGIRRVWADGRELDLATVEMRVHRGGPDQSPDPLILAKQGDGNAPAYRGTAYVVFDRFPLDDYGNRIPQFQFETIRPVGTLSQAVRAVALIPGATEYGLSPTLVTRSPREGETVALNRNALHGPTDLVASLDELQALCPRLEHVGLVVTWFGTDLRAGACRIRPKVTDPAAEGFSVPWLVAGTARGAAAAVSSAGGGAAYGGTPSDASVVAAIAELKARGLKVTLYPFVMMDIPAGNGLPDPYGGAEQKPYPWRGRITGSIAPGLPGTVDKTAAARAEVSAFCGSATAADFTAAEGAVVYAGPADDWSYRRFVLHYARLAALAGGVDAFLIGSELRGLTTLRDDTGAYPFVTDLADLVGEVRALTGGATAITYGADWSEYSGHRPADGSGDVFFHLDPLWAHPEVAAVGIDNYLPLADWRDADLAGGNPDGFAGALDPAGLARGIAGGEGFDWYYAGEAERQARLRTPIADAAYGKDWVFRPKDLVGWWSNPHFDRPGGTEAATPTAWVPRSKPIWFTELGCPAVDKGPNQPNVFPDPKSSESAEPHFSSGGRSDLAQRRFLETHQRHWDPAAAGFDAAANPLSELYGGRMVSPDRLYLWAWDARPFPAFPLLGGLWRDNDNWSRGHWLNGRLGALAAGDLVNAILADAGLPPAQIDGADGTLHGTVIARPTAPREAMEPIMDLFGLVATERGGTLMLRGEGAVAAAPRALTELVADGETVLRIERVADHALPTEALLNYRDPLRDHQAAAARAARAASGALRQATLPLLATMEDGEAQALLEDWLSRRWASRARVAFALPPAEVEIGPGTVFTLPGRAPGRFLVETVEEGLERRIVARETVPLLPAPNLSPLPAATEAPAAPGRPAVRFIDLPMAGGSENPEQRFRIAVWARPWRSQVVHAAAAASGYEPRGRCVLPATMGTLTAPLGPGREGRIDRRPLDALLWDGALSSVARDRLLDGANAAAVMSDAGGWEVLQFEKAEEVAPSQWRLTGLLRGQLGTGDQAAAGAGAGASFVLLDAAAVPAGLRSAEIGLDRYWRVGPSGHDLTLQHMTETVARGGVRALTPLSPVHLSMRADGAGWTFRWIRRGRIDADGWLGEDIPLGEEGEAYRVEIRPAPGAAPVRTAETASPAFAYTAASAIADLGALPATIELAVAQLGTRLGAGIPATSTFLLS